MLKKLLLRWITLVAAACGLAVPCQTAASTVSLSSGLVGWYQFEGNVQDSSVNANHGTAYGGLSYVDGIYGQAGHFDESLASYAMTQRDIPIGSSSYAISSWFRISSFLGSWEILAARQLNATTSWDDSWTVTLGSSGRLTYWSHTASQGTVANQAAGSVAAGQWHSSIINVDHGHGAMYLDGNFVGAFEQQGGLDLSSDMAVCIGCDDYNPGFPTHYMNGDLDDLRFYDRGLNADEIAFLASGAAFVPEPSSLMLVGAALVGLCLVQRKRQAR